MAGYFQLNSSATGKFSFSLKAGNHEIVAFFTGKGPHDRDYRRGTTLKVDKTVGAKYVMRPPITYLK